MDIILEVIGDCRMDNKNFGWGVRIGIVFSRNKGRFGFWVDMGNKGILGRGSNGGEGRGERVCCF